MEIYLFQYLVLYSYKHFTVDTRFGSIFFKVYERFDALKNKDGTFKTNPLSLSY